MIARGISCFDSETLRSGAWPRRTRAKSHSREASLLWESFRFPKRLWHSRDGEHVRDVARVGTCDRANVVDYSGRDVAWKIN